MLRTHYERCNEHAAGKVTELLDTLQEDLTLSTKVVVIVEDLLPKEATKYSAIRQLVIYGKGECASNT